MTPIYFLALILLILTGLLAIVRGGRWEKGVCLALAAAWVITESAPFDHRAAPWVAIAADGAVFLVLLYAALYSGRRWPMAAAAFQFLVLATHYVFARDLRLLQWAYVSAYYVWTIAVIICVLCGVLWRERQPEL